MRTNGSVPQVGVAGTVAQAAHIAGTGLAQAHAGSPVQFAVATLVLSTGGRAGYIAELAPFTVCGSDRARLIAMMPRRSAAVGKPFIGSPSALRRATSGSGGAMHDPTPRITIPAANCTATAVL